LGNEVPELEKIEDLWEYKIHDTVSKIFANINPNLELTAVPR
jgi:hypothetical protein